MTLHIIPPVPDPDTLRIWLCSECPYCFLLPAAHPVTTCPRDGTKLTLTDTPTLPHTFSDAALYCPGCGRVGFPSTTVDLFCHLCDSRNWQRIPERLRT